MARFSTVNSRSTGTSADTTLTPAKKPSFIRRLIDPFLRTFQLLSALTSLILFSLRIRKIINLYGQASKSNGAVEGILSAAVAYALITMLMKFCMKRASSSLVWKLGILFIIFDLLFVGAFIAVAVLTSPKTAGSSGPCTKSQRINNRIPGGINCALPWGTFALAIFSTILHALSVLWGMVRARKTKKTRGRVDEKDTLHNKTRHGVDTADGNGYRPDHDTNTDVDTTGTPRGYNHNQHGANNVDDLGYNHNQHDFDGTNTQRSHNPNQLGSNNKLDSHGYDHNQPGLDGTNTQRAQNPNHLGSNNVDASGYNQTQHGTNSLESPTFNHSQPGSNSIDVQRAHNPNQHGLDSRVGIREERV